MEYKGVPSVKDYPWKWFYTITAAYPLHKRAEFWPKHSQLVQNATAYPFLTFRVVVTIEDVRAGFLTHTMFLCKEGEGSAAYGVLRELMHKLFWDMEGFTYSLQGMWGV